MSNTRITSEPDRTAASELQTSYKLESDLSPTKDGLVIDKPGHEGDEQYEYEILPKHGHNFFFCFCDMRRSVIIINTITVVLSTIGIILWMIGTSLTDLFTENFEDDDEFRAMSDFLNGWVMAAGPYFVAVAIGKVMWGIIGILGAIQFEHAMVGFGSMSYFFDLALSIYVLNWYGIAYAAIMIYPHLILMKEIHDGHMCAQNYHNERHCCCWIV